MKFHTNTPILDRAYVSARHVNAREVFKWSLLQVFNSDSARIDVIVLSIEQASSPRIKWLLGSAANCLKMFPITDETSRRTITLLNSGEIRKNYKPIELKGCKISRRRFAKLPENSLAQGCIFFIHSGLYDVYTNFFWLFKQTSWRTFV